MKSLIDGTCHKWREEDEYGICECLHCGKLKKRKANTTYNLRSRGDIKWFILYSNTGSKWTMDHLPCLFPEQGMVREINSVQSLSTRIH